MKASHWMAGVLAAALLLPAGAADTADDEALPEEAVVALPHNVRLDFAIEPREGHSAVHVVTATPWYECRGTFAGKDGVMKFDVSGALRFVDDGRLLVTLDANINFEGNGEHGAFHLASGVLLTSGQSVAVCGFADKRLVIHVTWPAAVLDGT